MSKDKHESEKQADRLREEQVKLGDEWYRQARVAKREKITRIAAQIADILAGNADDAALDPTPPDPASASTPSAIPVFRWHKPGLPAGSNVLCNAGEYVSDKYIRQPGASVAFDAGFLAALLVVKRGLIDPTQVIDFIDSKEVSAVPEIPPEHQSS